MVAAVGLTGLALASACGSDSSPGSGLGSGSGRSTCVVLNDDGCICGAEPREDDVDFQGMCDENGVGERGVCCKRGDRCKCEPVQCGISSIGGDCLCGAGLLLDSIVGSCEGTASTCCTQDTGYCYCEDGCMNRFANRLVGSCDMSTSAATCPDGEEQVSSCQ